MLIFELSSKKKIVLISIKKNIKKINEKDISKNLMTAKLPDPDLVIRTSGEKRLSNFLLWQIAYSELYFTKTLWPDFSYSRLDLAINEFFKNNLKASK